MHFFKITVKNSMKGEIVVDCPLEELTKKHDKMAVVKVNLNEPILNINIEGATGTSEASGLIWSFEVDKSKTTTGHLIYEISKIAEISDIEIKEQAVEDIIHEIYLRGI